MTDSAPEDQKTPITSLSRMQRRVLGVLLEKGFTTPEQYPLTLKAATTGSNQKNNRDPITNYDEDQVEQTFDELRELGLAAVVHTESGRTARYRHYMRHRFTMSEQQLAILTELLLRGRQSLGELRTRASRMVAIDSLEDLRTALNGLLELGFVQSDGSLDRRGAEVDHNWYTASERQHMASIPRRAPEPVEAEPPRAAVHAAAPAPVARASAGDDARLAQLETRCAALENANRELREELDAVRSEFEKLSHAFEDLRRALGG
jgi:uncharacterized protein YceH (UPF0502 family)